MKFENILKDIINVNNVSTITPDELWAVHTIIAKNNGGIVPMDETNHVCYSYGVKGEKAKARKHHKANQKRNPGKRSAGLWYDEAYEWKKYDKYCKANSSVREKRNFRNSQVTLFDFDEEVNFIKSEIAEAEADYAEYLRIENMPEEEKAKKRAILKDALARYMISGGEMYEFTTERGTFMFSEDSWNESFYLFKKDENGRESYTSVYAIWDYTDGTYFDNNYDEVIEDMMRII